MLETKSVQGVWFSVASRSVTTATTVLLHRHQARKAEPCDGWRATDGMP